MEEIVLVILVALLIAVILVYYLRMRRKRNQQPKRDILLRRATVLSFRAYLLMEELRRGFSERKSERKAVETVRLVPRTMSGFYFD